MIPTFIFPYSLTSLPLSLLFGIYSFFLEFIFPLPFYLLFCFFLCCSFWVSQTTSILFCFPLFPRLLHLLYFYRLPWLTSLPWGTSCMTSRLKSAHNSPVAHSVCSFLHHFLKLTSSFNITSRQISSKVFSWWTLADDIAGIYILPENKIHPTISESSAHCPCIFIFFLPSVAVSTPYKGISSYMYP